MDQLEPTTEIEDRISKNLASVTELIQSACTRTNRPVDSVRLVAVTKYAELPWITALQRAGINDFGENRPQQLATRTPLFDPSVSWHMIGQLQRNKVRITLQNSEVIHSVDSRRLLDRIQLIASELKLKPKVLLEANVSGESAKAGFSPDDLRNAADQLVKYSDVDICGLMTMAPIVDTAENARPVFAGLRQLRDSLIDQQPELNLPELSMGMSGDFDIAIEEGATTVRIGSRLFTGCQ
ncbi:UNVERIFIED_CONTAM: hypothetical protein GTU68_001817 [Idotea baltica]|nr:hypothetical protein [Idotea baltica]